MRKGTVVILVILVIGCLVGLWYLRRVSRPEAPLPPPPGLVPEVPKPPPPVLKIGAVFPLSGGQQIEGLDAKKGLELAIVKVETEQGIKIELLVEDDKGQSSEAENLIHKLVMREKVLAVITGAVKDEAQVSHLAQELRIPILLLQESDVALFAGSPYLFGLGLAQEDEAAVLASFAKTELGLKNAGVLVDVKDASMMSAAAAFREVIEREGGQVVSQVSCISGDEDFSGQINRIRARGAEVLFAATGAAEGAKIITQARKAGFKAPILATSRTSSPAIIGLEKQVLGECYLTTYLSLDEKREALVSFLQSLGEEEASDTTALAHDAFSLLAQALSRAPEPTREALAKKMVEIKDFPGVTGTLSFKATGAIMRDIAVVEIGGAVPAYGGQAPGRQRRLRLFPPSMPEEVPAPVEVELP